MKNKLVLKFLAAALVVSMCVPQTAGMALAAAPAAVQTEIAGELDPANLKDGEYSVQIGLRNASNPENASMANNAVEPQASLFVRDGSYYLQVEFKGMAMGPLTGYLKSLSYWDGSAYREAEVLSSYEEIVDDYNDADNDGTADYLYPETLELPLLNKNAGDQDGYIRCQVDVPLMTSMGMGATGVLIAVDWDSLEAVKIEEDQEPGGDTVDQTALMDKIAEAEAITQGDKSDEAWQALQDAIAAAKEAAETADSADAVTQAVNALTQAIETFQGSQTTEPGGEIDVDHLEDGEYTLSFVANQEGMEESSMLQGAFDPRVKLTVKDGKMTISMMNTALVWALLDFSIESNGEYPQSEQKYIGTADASGNYSMQEFTMPIEDLSVMHKGAVLVTAMGGQISDKGNYEKYTKLDLTFGEDIRKGWEGYQYEIDQPEGADGSAKLVKALCDKGYDLNGDGKMSPEEIQAIEGPLDLSYQELTDISLLTNLSDKVTSIDLTENKIEVLPEGMLDNLVNLETFYASSNLIGGIPEGFFKNNGKLTWVNLSSNLIPSLEAGDFTGLTAATELDLGNNAIASVEEDTFEGLDALASLALNGNQLTALPDQVFDSLRNVTFLTLDDNQLTSLPASVGKMENLSWLTAARNQLASVGNVNFENLASLSQVDLSSNQIREIKSGTFAANTELSTLKLYNNCLTGFSADILPEGISMWTLDLQMNLLASVDDEVKALVGDRKIYPQLTDLNLTMQENGDRLEWSQDLTVLDLQYWYDATSSYTDDEITSVEDYRALLEREGLTDGDLVSFMDEKGYDWQIWTEIQKKDADGHFVSVSRSYENDQADAVSGSYAPEEDGTYRVVKTLYASTYGSLDYKFTAVSNEVTTEGGQVSVDAEKAALQEAIDAAKAVEQGNKTDTAWLILQNAISLAEYYLENSTDAGELQAAASDLQEAVELFQMSADVEPENPDDTEPETPDDTTPETPDDTTPENPDDTKPESPDDTKPENPDDTKPENPDDTAPENPSGGSQGGQNLSDDGKDPTSGTDQDGGHTSLNKSVKTGDPSAAVLWSVAALGGAALAAGTAAQRKRREEK